jgi:hypothetical protein
MIERRASFRARMGPWLEELSCYERNGKRLLGMDAVVR